MMKTFKATWLGDEDPAAQVIEVGDLRFVKGEAVDVPEDHLFASRIRKNPMFAAEKEKVDLVEAVEEPQPEEQGTELAALKATLRGRGQEVKGNPSVETLRRRLAELGA